MFSEHAENQLEAGSNGSSRILIFNPDRLPEWFRKALLKTWPGMLLLSDDALVDECVARWGGGNWLECWGRVVLKDVEVFLCESWTLLEPITLADELGCCITMLDDRIGPDNYIFVFHPGGEHAFGTIAQMRSAWVCSPGQ